MFVLHHLATPFDNTNALSKPERGDQIVRCVFCQTITKFCCISNKIAKFFHSSLYFQQQTHLSKIQKWGAVRPRSSSTARAQHRWTIFDVSLRLCHLRQSSVCSCLHAPLPASHKLLAHISVLCELDEFFFILWFARTADKAWTSVKPCVLWREQH